MSDPSGAPAAPEPDRRRLRNAFLPLLPVLALAALAACERTAETGAAPRSETVAAARPDPSYGGPARPVRGRERLHRVESGDSMDAIAGLYGMEAGDIERLNGLVAPYSLFVGEFLILPEGGAWGTAPEAGTVASHPVDKVEARPLGDLN